MKIRKKDNIFARATDRIAAFEFDDKVASVFADMIERSVPGYADIIRMLPVLAERFAVAGSNCYDLGCSLGAVALALRAGIKAPGCRIYAVDNAPAMIARCRDHAAAPSPFPTPIETLCADIREIEFSRAAIVVLNFTLQFLPVADREPLLRRIYDGMVPGGIVVLSEKITHDDPYSRDLLIDIYHAWKHANGYSQLEISQKRTALENVLRPETLAVHRRRLEQIGFRHCEPWFQCFNFMSLTACK
ncbi:MAG: carboxy-S-adenosyl-L-methionine synthase CmoA [Victivallales bacterium]|nr:carboxy-S-adenosyl-L-methionine synthase CmoA [Victivallales bacterium]